MNCAHVVQPSLFLTYTDKLITNLLYTAYYFYPRYLMASHINTQLIAQYMWNNGKNHSNE